jgi:hypothetical protein
LAGGPVGSSPAAAADDDEEADDEEADDGEAPASPPLSSSISDAARSALSDATWGAPPPPPPPPAAATAAALRGLAAAWGWPDAPRPVLADDLLPERALAGDSEAVTALIDTVHEALLADAALYDTACAYLERTPSLEATARALFIHPNTVRYRLRRIAEITGYSPTEPRGAYSLRVGLTLGRLSEDGLA